MIGTGNVRYWGNSVLCQIFAGNGYDANDQTATLALRCGNGFDAGFDFDDRLVCCSRFLANECRGWWHMGGL